MVFKDYYKILGLETSRVSLEEIKSAYRIAAKKYHPDVNIGDKLAEERIKDINEAYKVLSTSNLKRKYDRTWNSNVGKRSKIFENTKKQGNSVISEYFNMLFGNVENVDRKEKISEPNKKQEKGVDIDTKIDITLEEAYFGREKIIVLKTSEGTSKNIKIKIPNGILSGEKIRLIGQGQEGKNGGKNGDLYIEINLINSEKIKIKGYDLYTNLLLTPWEAALGARTSIESIGEHAQIYIPQGIQTGEKVRIPGKGYWNSNGGRGDLIAEVKIVVPKQLTEDEKNKFEELKELSNFNPRDFA